MASEPRGLWPASFGHRSHGCPTSWAGVSHDAPAPAGLLSPSADPSMPEESLWAPSAPHLPRSARLMGKLAPSRTVLLWGTLWLLSPRDVPHLGWCCHGRGTQRPYAARQGLSPASQPTPRSPRGDAQVRPSRVCAPKRYSLLPNQLHVERVKLQRGTSRCAQRTRCFSGGEASSSEICLPALPGAQSPQPCWDCPAHVPPASCPGRLACILLLSLLKQSVSPKLSRPVGTTPAQAPSLEMQLRLKGYFPLLHPFGFLCFLPHKNPSSSSLRMHINCKCIPRFGREIN